MARELRADLVGTVAVVDLESACEMHGRDSLPHPVGRSRPVGSVWLATRAAAPIEDRLDYGDLRELRSWIGAFVRADAYVECRVTYCDEASDDLRLHALRTGERGFVAVQRRDRDGVDVVDVYSALPEVLGEVVEGFAGLVGAGSLWRIAVAGPADDLPASQDTRVEYDDLGFLIPRADDGESRTPIVDACDVLSTGTVQSWQRFASERGMGGQGILRWVHVDGDGDYLFESKESRVAEPLGTGMLAGLIDGLIVDEMAMARERRR